MSINCKDASNGKLVLAVDFLSYLNRLDTKIQITCASEFIDAYLKVFSMFENITLVENEPGDIHILFSDNIKTRKHFGCIFPIIPADHIVHEREQNVIPVDKSRILGGHFLADFGSACLMFDKILLKNDFADTRFLISAGPTAEDIDPVRFLTNRSSGKMGLALAQAAYTRGAQVKLVIGPGNINPPLILDTVQVRSASDMHMAIMKDFPDCHVYIGTAAIADFTPEKVQEHKIKKGSADLGFKLKRTKDVLSELSKIKKKQKLVGFSVETMNVIENSLKKLENKNLDMIVVNNPKEEGSGFAADTNQVSVLLKNRQMYKLPMMNKLDVAHKILDHLKKI